MIGEVAELAGVVKVEFPESSDLAWFEYHTKTQLLDVKFKKGGTYRYHGVPCILVFGLLFAPSKGHFFHARIRDNFKTKKVAS